MDRRWLIAALLVTRSAVAGAGAPSGASEPAAGGGLSPDGRAGLRAMVEAGRVPDLAWTDFTACRDDVSRFYQAGADDLAWVRGGVPTGQARSVARALEAAARLGLDPDDYDGPAWRDRIEALDARAPAPEQELVRFDVGLTVSAIRYVSDLSAGRLGARTGVGNVGRVRLARAAGEEHVELAAFVRGLLGAADVDAALAAAEPPFATYRRTVAAFQRYLELAAAGDVQLAARAEQLKLTIERWRWLPHGFPVPPLVVNIPEFRLHVVDPTAPWSMKVVVGRAYRHRTPVFSAEMTQVIFHPAWFVPLSIQREDLVPRVEKDAGFLAEGGYEILDSRGGGVGVAPADAVEGLRSGALRLRQLPGPANALGAVEFVFPNPQGIFLHGTPAQELFARARRDFSHGCIRVEDPLALAAWVLRDEPGWTLDRVRAAMDGSETIAVKLAHRTPVLVLYGTAVVAESGEVTFLDDVYGRDAALARALARESALRREPRP